MTKKVFLIIVFAFIFIFSFSKVSFAKSDNTTTTLGNEVTTSINKTEKNMNDLVDRTDIDKAGQTIENGAKVVGNAVSDGMDNIRRGADDLVDGNDDGMNNDRVDNRAIVGTTGNYTAAQTGDTTGTTRNGMTQNAWIWIVMVVVSLIIVAAVWYYATQK